MSTRSIYQKACPSCAALVEIDAKICGCGYSFDLSMQEAELLPHEQANQEAELLREYLNARIGQAVADLQNHQAELAADPKNLEKANRLMKAYVALHDLRAELDAQSGTEIPRQIFNEPVAAKNPTTAFRAMQAKKAEQVMQAAGMQTKECPKCHVVLPERAALCFCGHAFAQAEADTEHPTTAPAIEKRERF